MPRFAADLAPGRWLNYLGDDQGDDAVRGAYGPNYQRLAEIKRQYDPENVFRHNHNIPPADVGAPRRQPDRYRVAVQLGRRLVLGEAPLQHAPREHADQPAVLDDGHALCVVLLEEAKGLLERDVRADRVVRLLGDRGDGRLRRVAPLGDDPRDERLAGDDPGQPLAVDHEDGPHLGPDQELTGLARSGVPGQRPRVGHHRVANPVHVLTGRGRAPRARPRLRGCPSREPPCAAGSSARGRSPRHDRRRR